MLEESWNTGLVAPNNSNCSDLFFFLNCSCVFSVGQKGLSLPFRQV